MSLRALSITLFEAGLGQRKVIYRPFPQAVPKYPVIDAENCIYFNGASAKPARSSAPPNPTPLILNRKTNCSNSTWATSSWPPATTCSTCSRIPQYGYGRLANVFTSLEFERMVNASGPTSGKIVLRDMETAPESVAIIHCVGSRDENYHEYCSKVCCMYSLKFAHLVHERLPESRGLQLLH